MLFPQFCSFLLVCSFQFCFGCALPFTHFVYCLPGYPRLSIFHRVFNVIYLIFYFFYFVCIKYILSSADGLFRCITVWLDTLDASSWDRLNLHLTDILPLSHFGNLRQFWNNNAFCISFRLFTFCATRYRSAQFVRRAFSFRDWQTLFPSPGAYILSFTDKLIRCVTTLQGG